LRFANQNLLSLQVSNKKNPRGKPWPSFQAGSRGIGEAMVSEVKPRVPTSIIMVVGGNCAKKMKGNERKSHIGDPNICISMMVGRRANTVIICTSFFCCCFFLLSVIAEGLKND